MKARRFLAAFVLIGCAAALAVGLVELFELRFSAGDVYPPYSTLRSDPLGAKALYASLAEVDGLRLERNMRPLARLDVDSTKPAAFFHLAASAAEWPHLFNAVETSHLDRFLRRGGRVVITFAPTESTPSIRKPRHRTLSSALHPDDEEAKFDAAQYWKIDFHRVDPKDPGKLPEPRSEAKAWIDVAVEPTASWHSAPDFELNERAIVAGWSPIYMRGDRAVMVKRDFPGAGRLVLATDSYLFSNEALRNEPHPVLLASLIGPARRLIFDETQFGINEKPGWMALARRFHLQAALGALALLTALFVWKGASSLVPTPRETTVGTLAGRDSASGFLSLVRRSIAPRDLLRTCVDRWASGANPPAVARLRVILQGKMPIPAAYRALCEAAKQRATPRAGSSLAASPPAPATDR